MNTKPIITLTCDFGDTFAVGQVESVIQGINPEVKFILASNNVHSFSITEGAFIIQKFSQFTPKNTVHIGVIDPGVGSDRIGIIVKTKDFYYVGPNNGLFYPAAVQNGIEQVYKIDEEKIGSLSNTFHGRDIFAKVAAYLTTTRPIEEFASPLDKNRFIPLEYKENQIVHIDPYGNIKVNNPAQYNEGEKLQINNNGKTHVVPFVKTFADVQPGHPLAYKGSHDTLEIAVNLNSAQQILGLNIEDKLEIKKIQ